MSCRCNYNCRVSWHQVLEGPTYFNPLLAQHTIGRTYNGEHPLSIASAHTVGTTTGGIMYIHATATHHQHLHNIGTRHYRHSTTYYRHNIISAQQGISSTLLAQHTIGTSHYRHNRPSADIELALHRIGTTRFTSRVIFNVTNIHK